MFWKSYDVFISYRREEGFQLAHNICERLKKRYRVFLDTKSLHSGKFDKKLYKFTEQCSDFIVVLSPGCLDKCNQPSDWFRLEIAHALRNEKNIIPLLMSGFTMPANKKDLPDDICDIINYEAIKIDPNLYEESMDRLEKSLIAYKKRKTKKLLSTAIIGGALLSFLLGYAGYQHFYLNQDNNGIKETQEKILPPPPEGQLSQPEEKVMVEKSLIAPDIAWKVQVDDSRSRGFNRATFADGTLVVKADMKGQDKEKANGEIFLDFYDTDASYRDILSEIEAYKIIFEFEVPPDFIGPNSAPNSVQVLLKDTDWNTCMSPTENVFSSGQKQVTMIPDASENPRYGDFNLDKVRLLGIKFCMNDNNTDQFKGTVVFTKITLAPR